MKRRKKFFIVVFIIIIIIMLFQACRKKDLETYIQRAEKLEDDNLYELAMKQWKRALTISIRDYSEISTQTAYIYRNMGESSSKVTESLEYLNQALTIYEALNDIKGIGETYYSYGVKYKAMGQKDEALTWLKKAEKYYEQTDEMTNIQQYNLYTNIGLLISDYNESLEYYLKCESLLEGLVKNGISKAPQSLYHEIAIVHYKGRNYLAAIEYFEKAIDEYSKNGYEESRENAEMYDYCGYSYVLIGDYENGYDYVEKAIKIYEDMSLKDNYSYMSEAYLHMSHIYYLQKPPEYQKALEYGIKACQCYASQKTLLNDDILKFKKLKEDLQSTYEKAELSGDFEDWFRDNVKIKTKSVEVQLR